MVEGNMQKAYWQANVRLILGLLSLWAFVSFGCGILLLDDLNQFRFFGFKLGFWFAHQGAMYFFLVIICVYIWRVNALDKKYGVDEVDE